MINLDATTAPARSAVTGSPDTAPAGDFLAVLAALVTDLTTEASPDGSGLLLPGSPLLDGSLDPEAAAELDAMLEEGLVETDGADGDAELGIPWPSVQALAGLLAQPTAPAPETPPSPGAGTSTGDSSAEAGYATTSALAGPAAAGRLAPATEAEAQLAPATAATDAAAGDEPALLDGSAPTATATMSAAGATPDTAGATLAAMRSNATDTIDAAQLEGETVADAAAAEDLPAPAEAADTARRAVGAEARTTPVEATETLADSQPATDLRTTPVRDRGPMTSTAAGVARVLDALDRLELAPPPRQVTLDFGDLRVRVAMDDGGVRMQLLGEQPDDGGREFLRAAEEALRERGFDLTGDARGEHAGQQRPDLAPPRPERVVGRPGRATDPTSTGVRPGVHL